MKILVTAKGNTPDSQIDERFGRAEFFMIYDDQKDTYEVVENIGKLENSGAGVRASQFVIDQKVDALITGALGPKAFMIIDEVGLKAWKNKKGSVKEIVSAYKEDKLTLINQAGDEVKKRGNK
jgi:predicted Fe-Mo cluster-binding NifX family protein